MGALASSLREALTARGGPRAASPKPEGQRHQRSSAGASTSTDAAKLGLDSDPNAIQWRPPNIKKAPELVSAPQRVAPGAGASKEKGLAKQLLVPPRANSPPPASAAEASKRWAELPATKITEEVKTELRLLRLRGAYDPKRFYKSFDETKFPKHFQIGTVLDSPGEFYSSRLTQRERGATITQEILADPSIEHARRKRYAKLQAEAVKHHRVKKRKTDLKRANNKPKRQKH
ncbi:hypothetical protein HYH03_017338 [Edaphochlamys debaryana]|uniref:Fcf2 pre-rRNA processing C-terminal domain-containing protein n=1 Tax=Edaphochlamys debaryana TaxID=47281 RepID=A0A835XMR9_9CHLO|nr:hypothetical protein HYH03_017338 [Edaphochlamys debaryana]|eukprot:KAG2483815.1 hypothetical protein HYH03_017338 [Edaphochlamys debaryana]